jgi:hypothetical protein
MKQHFYTSNKYHYVQFASTSGKIVSTTRQSKLNTNNINNLSFYVKNDIGYDLVSLYNETNLKYSSLNYLLMKNKSIYVNSNTNTKKLIQRSIEFAIESGIK